MSEPIVQPTQKEIVEHPDYIEDVIEKMNLPHPDYEG
jgi:hypothetical protein